MTPVAPASAPLQLVLDDAELTAATALLMGAAADDELGEVVEVGKVRLQARNLLGRTGDPEQPVPVDHAVVALVGTSLRAQDSLTIAIRRRSKVVTTLALSFHRLGDMVVEHVSASGDDGSEVHSLTALPRADDVVDRVMQLLVEADQPSEDAFAESELYALSVDSLERARAAAATGDAEELDRLPPQLAHAFRRSEAFAQVARVKDGGPGANLTVLTFPGQVWTFLQSDPAQPEVRVQRASATGLRRQVQELWPT